MLKMTHENELTLTNVTHVSKIQKNLVSTSLLSKNDFKLLFESEKFVLVMVENRLDLPSQGSLKWRFYVKSIAHSFV